MRSGHARRAALGPSRPNRGLRVNRRASTESGFDVEPAEPAGSRVVYTTSFTNLRQEIGKLEDLYGWVMDSRREAGGSIVPFHKFVDVVRNRVDELRDAGSTEVVCQAAVKDGRVSWIMRGVKADP